MNTVINHLSHGGRTAELAAAAGIAEQELLDFSANLNPLGPPPWLADAVAEGFRRISLYPDPEAGLAQAAAASQFMLPQEHFLFADGADALLLALPRALRAVAAAYHEADVRCIVPSPSYSGYLRAGAGAGLSLQRIALDPEEGFSLASPVFLQKLEAALRSPAIVLLGAPNNPAGGAIPKAVLQELARLNPLSYFIVDESFNELSRGFESCMGCQEANIIVVRSMTKTWAVPGARIGFAAAAPAILSALRKELSAWPLSSFAEAIAVRALRDTDYPQQSAAAILRLEAAFAAALEQAPHRVLRRLHRAGTANGLAVNFILLEFASPKIGQDFYQFMLKKGIATRKFSPPEGLDARYIRVAVRPASENARFIAAFFEFCEHCA